MYPLSLRPRSICFWLPPHVLIIRAQPSIRRTFLHEPSTTKYQSFRNKLYLIGLFANHPNKQPFGFQSAVVWSTSQRNPEFSYIFCSRFLVHMQYLFTLTDWNMCSGCISLWILMTVLVGQSDGRSVCRSDTILLIVLQQSYPPSWPF